MTGGPWARSMKVVHGPGPKWGSMDPWSVFCPHPFFSPTCRVASVIWQKSKKIATDSNYLRCHALLTALHFPLETTWSCKQDRKERYWGQQFWQMERDSSVRPTEMTRPVTVDHLQSWSRIFRSDQTEMVRSIWWTNRKIRTFGLNGKRPRTRKWKLAVFFPPSVTPLSTIFWSGVL